MESKLGDQSIMSSPAVPARGTEPSVERGGETPSMEKAKLVVTDFA